MMRIGDNLQSFGCNATGIEYPLIKKLRYVRVGAKHKYILEKSLPGERADTRRGIIWPIKIERHIVRKLRQDRQCDDIPWHLKEPVAFWRGV